MRSSISSSEMIAKSILVCLLLFLAYSALLPFAPDLSASQAQWQQNLQKAEQYLYADANAKSLIIGTSMAERLVTERIPDCDNLSFAGLSVFDGLSLLRHKDRLPSSVYIETNVLLRKRDGDFSESLFSPIPFLLRRRVIALRADKQPLALIGQSLGNTIRERGKQIKHKLLGPTAPMADEPDQMAETPALDDRMLDLEIRDYSEKPSATLLNGQLQLLIDDVSYLKSKGVQVAFFEMPVNPKLTALPKAQLIRDGMHVTFPKVRFHYIELPPDSASYVTTDGIHLTPKEAARYTRYFLEQVTKLSASN
jgi:hypothetical protein